MAKKMLFKKKKRLKVHSSRIPIKIQRPKLYPKLITPIKLPPKSDVHVEVSIRKKVAGQAPEEYHFVLADGKKLKDMLELVESLETMTEDVYSHHVNEFKNDFSNWVRDIFNEHELADEIAKINNKVDTQIAVMRHLLKKIRE